LPNLKQIARQLIATEGAEILEAALVLPLVFMLLLGTIWFGRAFNIYSTIQQAAQQGAIAAARDSCATCGNAETAPGAVDTVVSNVLQADNLSLSQIQKWEANTPTPGLLDCPAPAPAHSCNLTGNKIWVCSSVLLNSSTQPAQCGAMVSFQYPFSFSLLSLTSLGSVTMSAQAQSRMEN
jgi:Flp pilus assembly protein TadG